MKIDISEKIVTNRTVYSIDPILCEDKARQLTALSEHWVESGALLSRSPRDLLPENNCRFYLLRDDKGCTVAGFGLHMYQSNIEIKNICVAHKHVGRGIGKAIVSYLINKLEVKHRLVAFSAHSFEWFLKIGFRLVNTSEISCERVSQLDPKRPSLLLVFEKEAEPNLNIYIKSTAVRFAFKPDLDRTILDAAKREGVDVEYLCEAGICGSCSHSLRNGIFKSPPLSMQQGNDVLLCETIPISNLEFD